MSALSDAELLRIANELGTVIGNAMTEKGVGFVLLIVDPESGKHVLRTNYDQKNVATTLDNALKFARSHKGFIS